jgi:ribosomal protein L20
MLGDRTNSRDLSTFRGALNARAGWRASLVTGSASILWHDARIRRRETTRLWMPRSANAAAAHELVAVHRGACSKYIAALAVHSIEVTGLSML